ncbi:hypothetical protein CAXC1_90014 [Candidatus Xenohaliotis californiensis]|uniref:Uncharacterized protein n=1 Tax=Candidatus Xenohaliotis californiensis TaxID=84677 RepID=A0ABP0EWL4_9RICK|nr:hypothetical protein CAXC1_90014 [Candidatus Xenohaliotis californiensis]
MGNQEYSINSDNTAKDIKKSKGVMFFLLSFMFFGFSLCLLFVNWYWITSQQQIKDCSDCNQDNYIGMVDKFFYTLSINQCHAVSIASLAIVDLYASLYWLNNVTSSMHALKTFTVNNWQDLGSVYGEQIMQLVKMVESNESLIYRNPLMIALELDNLISEINEDSFMEKNFFSLIKLRKKEKNIQNIKLKNELLKLSSDIKHDKLSLSEIYSRMENNPSFVDFVPSIIYDLRSTIKLKQAFKEVVDTMHNRYVLCSPLVKAEQQNDQHKVVE